MVYPGLLLLDWTFHTVHLAIILLNTFGWMFRGTQSTALFFQSLTLLSWFGLGRIYGFGYCFVTDWHSRVQKQLGKSGFPQGYIKFLVDRIPGLNIDPVTTDRITATVLFIALLCSLSKTLAWPFPDHIHQFAVP